MHKEVNWAAAVFASHAKQQRLTRSRFGRPLFPTPPGHQQQPSPKPLQTLRWAAASAEALSSHMARSQVPRPRTSKGTAHYNSISITGWIAKLSALELSNEK